MFKGTVSGTVTRIEKNKKIMISSDLIAEELPIALIYNGISHVIMMASPNHLEEFALGFSLSENIVQSPNEIYDIDIRPVEKGIEIHIELSSRRFAELKEQKRALVGRTGCGICGSEHMDRVRRPLPTLSFGSSLPLSVLLSSMAKLKHVQKIGKKTGCTHASVWVSETGHLYGGFEDIGRHVALDKILGFRARHSIQTGAILISSRASYEMVQKSVQCGAEILCAASAPTSLAVEMAESAQLTLVGFCRNGRASIYTHAARIKL